MPGVTNLSGTAAARFTHGMVEVGRLLESRRPSERARVTAELVRNGSLREAMNSDDLPLIMAGIVDKNIRQAYGQIVHAWQPLARVVSFPNFRAQTIVELGELEADDEEGNTTPSGTFPRVPENGMYNDQRFSGTAETGQVCTYGGTFTLTRQMLINDDTRSLTRIPEIMGAAMARTINEHARRVFELNASAAGSGPIMSSDGAQLFCAAHDNFVSAAMPLTHENLLAALELWDAQTTPLGFPLLAQPRFLVVPTALRYQADYLVGQASNQLMVHERDLTGTLTTVVPTRNVLAGYLQPIVIPELRNTQDWYLLADPNEISVLEYALLNGQSSPATFTQDLTAGDLHAADGQAFKIRFDFGFYPACWRGCLKVNDTTA